MEESSILGVDFQVKLRGQRIELEEIESVIRQHSTITGAVVAVKEDSNKSQFLVGYITPDTVDTTDLKSFLSSKLASYMIPSVWMKMTELPLNTSGKVDRKALPYPDFSSITTANYTPPSSATEMKLRDIWSEVRTFQLTRSAPPLNFFELGGNSLSAVKVVSLVRNQIFAGFALADFFSTQQSLQHQHCWISKKLNIPSLSKNLNKSLMYLNLVLM